MDTPLLIPTEHPSLTLRQLTVEDAPAYFEAVAANRDHLSQFDDDTSEKYPTLQSVVDSFEHPKDPSRLRFGMFDGDTFVGSANLRPKEDGSAEIGYWVDGRHLRKGYASAAARAITAFAAERHDRVYAEVTEGNDLSAEVLKKNSFRQIGRDGIHMIFDYLDRSKYEGLTPPRTRELESRDLGALLPILKGWIKSRDDGKVIESEVSQVLKDMTDSMSGRNFYKYFVAEDKDGKAVAVMGLKPPGDDMLQYTTTSRPIELINAYADPYTGLGAGGALTATLETYARENRFEEIILDSGPRNKHSGWDFWMKKFGKPIAVAKGRYSNGADALVWSKVL